MKLEYLGDLSELGVFQLEVCNRNLLIGDRSSLYKPIFNFYFQEPDDKGVIYSLFGTIGTNKLAINYYERLKNYEGVINKFKNNYFRCVNDVDFNIFKVVNPTSTTYLYITFGMILDENNDILACLGIKNKVYDFFQEVLDEKNQILFISSKFKDPKYKNFLRRFNIGYIDYLKESGVDVIETNRIEEWLFSNNLEIPKFKNLEEMNKYVKEETTLLLRNIQEESLIKIEIPF